MTAGLVIVRPAEIVLVADTLVTGWATPGAEKLVIHSGKSAIFTYGCGPGDVQEKVRGLDPFKVIPEALARELHQAFRTVSAPYRFGVYVAGFDGAQPSLWHVDVPAPGSGTQDRTSNPDPHSVAPPGTHEILNAWLDLHRSMDDPVMLGVTFVQQAHALAPRDVGADTKRVRVTASGAGWA